MLPFKFVVVLALVSTAFSQNYDYETGEEIRPAPARIKPGYSGAAVPKPTPVPILKQINRHNEDGSYTYGYEGADGSFKIETKLPNGEVKGKYGYVDDQGKVRVVEYGATKYGFEPSGEGITVPPPTLVDETTNKDGTLNPEYADQYYEPAPAPAPLRPAPIRPAPKSQTQQQIFEFTAPQQFAPAPQRNPSPVPARSVVSGAAPIEYVPQTKPPGARKFGPASLRPSPLSFSNPAPIEEQYDEPQPQQRPLPKISYSQPSPASTRPLSQFESFGPSPAPAPRPAPQFIPAPAPAPLARPAPVPRPAPRPLAIGGRQGGILDQLSRDYALPETGAAPLHDISFGYY